MLERLSTQLIKAGGRIYHWCPACKSAHSYNVDPADKPVWTFNGNNTTPTFTPSMLIFTPAWDAIAKKYDYQNRRVLCHYFMTNGQLQFLNDCPHALKGQTVAIPEFPAGYGIGNDVT